MWRAGDQSLFVVGVLGAPDRGGGSSGSVNSSRRFDNRAEALGGDVTRRVRKLYIGYFRGKRAFTTVEVQKSRLLVRLSLDPTSTTPWDEQLMRDVSNIGHFGMGDLEFSLTKPEQMAQVVPLMEAAYAKKAGSGP